MSEDGEPRHAGDMAAQVALSLSNLEAVLGEAGMSLADLVRLTVYTTDVDRLLEHYGVLVSRLQAAGAAPPTTMLGVSRLALPDLMVELEGPPSPDPAPARRARVPSRRPQPRGAGRNLRSRSVVMVIWGGS